MQILTKAQTSIMVIFLIFLMVGCSSSSRRVKRFEFTDNLKVYDASLSTGGSSHKTKILFLETDDFFDDTVYILSSGDRSGFPEEMRGRLKVNTLSLKTRYLDNITHFYELEAIKTDHIFELELSESPYFKKIKRVMVESPGYASGDTQRFTDNTFSELERKLVKLIIENGGDAAMDICTYIREYELIDSISKESGYGVAYKYNFVIVGTIIKFINGYYPDKKFLLKAATAE